MYVKLNYNYLLVQVYEPAPLISEKCGTDVEMDSMISSVQDLLPHLGAGYVEACLQHYSFKVLVVFNIYQYQDIHFDSKYQHTIPHREKLNPCTPHVEDLNRLGSMVYCALKKFMRF